VSVFTLYRTGARMGRDWWASASTPVRLLLFAASAAVSALVLRNLLLGHELIDLQVYRFGVEAWMSGGDPYGPMPQTSIGVGLPYLYPPPSLVLLAPFALMPLWAAKVVGTALTLIALIVTIWVVISRCWPRARDIEVAGGTALVLPIALSLEPVDETLTFGQLNIWLMALVTLDLLARNPRWPRGLLIGVAFALKLTPAAFILFFLLRRDYRAALVTVLSGAAFVALGFLVAWKASVAYWFTGAGPTDGVSGTPFGTNQTILASLRRLVIPETTQTVIWIAMVGLVVGVGVLLMVRLDAPTAFVVNAAIALLVAPTAWSHHWIYCVPALIVLGYHVAHRRLSILVALGVLAVFYYALHQDLPRGSDTEFGWTWFEHIYGDSYVIVALLLLAVTMWKVRERKPAAEREMARGDLETA
jgi:alpha-1,2-mannosyltransferase